MNTKQNSILSNLRAILFMLSGVAFATIGLKGFLLPNGFIDGGAMGVSLLLNRLTGLNISILILAVNLPFIYIAYRQIGYKFAIATACSILLLSLAVRYVQLPIFTHDKLLIAIFGGVCLGAGIGCSMRGGSVIDGTEVLAIYVSRRGTITVGGFIALFNVLLFFIAAFLIDIETAMYSMLTYLSASKSVDFIINGIEEYIGVTIVSPHHKEIRHKITDDLGRGVTVYRAAGGFKGANDEDRKILFCVVTRLEITRLLQEIEQIDPKAFVVQHSIKDTRGGILKRRPMSDN